MRGSILTLFAVFLFLALMNTSGIKVNETLVSEECKDFTKVMFIPEADMHKRFPPLLASFQGSGNTWTRLIIEFMTGFYTGSIDRYDVELTHLFPGERACGIRMSVIRGHPGSFALDDDGLVYISDKFERKKCARPGLVTTFPKIVLLTRDPYRSIFADFQRRLTNNHTGAVSNLTVSNNPGPKVQSKWYAIALEESQYFAQHWNRFVYPMLQKYQPHRVMVLRYEALTNPQMRYGELERLMQFMGYNYSTTRARCAFSLSETPSVHRKQSWSIATAYTVNSTLICAVWKHVRDFSSNFSYPVFGGVTCPSL